MPDKSPTNKSSRRPKPKIFNTLFLGRNKLKQRNHIRTKLRLEELKKGKTWFRNANQYLTRTTGSSVKNSNASEVS